MNKTISWILLLFALFFKSSFADVERTIKIYSPNNSITKVLFNLAEVASSSGGLPVCVSFSTKKEIKENILDGKTVDLIITDDYEFLRELHSLGILDLSKIVELFYERLVYIPLKAKNSEANLNSTEKIIFFKTSKEDVDITDNNANKIPSILIQSTNVCKEIDSLLGSYQNSKEYIILKQSIAKKCDLKYSAFFDDLYNLYYIATIKNPELSLSEKTLEFFKNSKKSHEVIRGNGYNI